jgi:hypothetical protein
MGLRRERPSQDIATGSVNIRLGDGTSVRLRTTETRRPATAAVCCFCGEEVDASDPRQIMITASRPDESREETRSWSAHESCLAARLHESAGTL